MNQPQQDTNLGIAGVDHVEYIASDLAVAREQERRAEDGGAA